MNKVSINTSKSKTLGLLLAALVPTGAALANGDYGTRHSRNDVEVGGTVVVTKEIPGGIITVGATIGHPRPVVVEQRKVVVVEKDACGPRQVTIIRKEPVREVTIIREAPVRTVIVREAPKTKVVIIKQVGKHGKVIEKRIITRDEGHHGRGYGHHDRDYDRHDRDDHGRQVSYQHQDNDGSHTYYRDANQVSESRSGRDGNYTYYEDAHQVSIQDNRGGQNKQVYVRK